MCPTRSFRPRFLAVTPAAVSLRNVLNLCFAPRRRTHRRRGVVFPGRAARRSVKGVSRRWSGRYAITRDGLAPITEVRFGPDGQWLEGGASAAGSGVSPAARIWSVLSAAQAAVWFLVKVCLAVISAAFILIFAAAVIAAMFAGGSSSPIGR